MSTNRYISKPRTDANGIINFIIEGRPDMLRPSRGDPLAEPDDRFQVYDRCAVFQGSFLCLFL